MELNRLSDQQIADMDRRLHCKAEPLMSDV